MLLSKDDFMRAMRGPDARTALHGFAQSPDAPLLASLQQLVDEVIRDSNRARLIVSCRRGGPFVAMAEIARQMASRADRLAPKNENGGATVSCPWGREDGRETFYPADHLPMNDPSKKVADSAPKNETWADLDALRYALEVRVKEKESEKPSTDLKPRHVADKLRINDILAAMSASNVTDKAIPEEWMDELSDLVWRERDRLEPDTATEPLLPIHVRFKE
jgi:hypothetical protein